MPLTLDGTPLDMAKLRPDRLRSHSGSVKTDKGMYHVSLLENGATNTHVVYMSSRVFRAISVWKSV